jgi:Flp pilus assembly protein TadG
MLAPAPPRRPARRRGATIVELALLLSLFLMFLFGIFEYCRFLLVLQTATNAARDGARYAVVNLDKPSNFDTTDFSFTYTNPSTGATVTKSYECIADYTQARMGGVDKMLSGWAVTVFPCNTASLYATPPVVQPKAGYPSAAVAWNSAVFTERVAVKITGTFKTILPNLLFLDPAIPVTVVALSGSEG